MLTYEPLTGEHIRNACEEALRMAEREGAPVRFSFNEIELTATVGTTAGDLEAEYDRASEERRLAYEQSPEGRAAANELRDSTVRAQSAVDALLERLPEVRSLNDTIQWLDEYTEHADHIGVNGRYADVAQTLTALGYVENEHVGKPSEWFTTRDRVGRYIVGQALDCFAKNMPPHPMLRTFAEKYRALSE